MYRSTVRCYDCHRQVTDLRTHRQECPNSDFRRKSGIRSANPRYTKSRMTIDSGREKQYQRGSRASHKNNVVKGTTDFYMVLDVSASMMGTRLAQAKESLLDIFSDMKDNDRISVVCFDTNPFFKLYPRAVGQVRRQGEMGPLMDRIFAKGMTAIWDAIHLTVSQIVNKERKTLINVLTDGEDNSSKHTYEEVLDLVNEHPNVTLNIIHVGTHCPKYEKLCAGRGEYKTITETTIKKTVYETFKKHYTPPDTIFQIFKSSN